MNNMDCNQVTIVGQIVGDFIFNHEIFGERFYLVNISVPRLSNSTDIIPVMISERLVDISKDYLEMYVVVTGQFRSFNLKEKEGNHLILSVFARNVEFLKIPTEDELPSIQNYIYLDGYVCKQPIYRKTPLGREICDILLAVNRPYGKSDYIPCICWGRNARYAGEFQIGDQIQLCGRIQSREYVKLNEIKIAYEVSVAKIETPKEEGAA